MALLDSIRGVFSSTTPEGEPKESIFKKPSVIMIMSALFLIICLLITHFYYFNPKIKNFRVLIAQQNQMNSEINQTKPMLITLQKKVEELTVERNTTAKLFVSEQEVEELYQLISFSALRNKLVLGNLNRGKEEVIYEDAAKTIVDFKKISVKFSIDGTFSTYMSLRKEIAELDKNVYFEKETIRRNEDGTIRADVELSMLKMPG
jgi:Tfp pilus assembly protein PilO